MKGATMNLVVKTILVALCAFGLPKTSAQLSTNFYDQPHTSHFCPQAPYIIFETVYDAVKQDPGNAADVLRLHFHDCFVQGCDGSALINSTPTNTAEKDGLPNAFSLEGFDLVNQAKARLEAECPRIVSCADIVAQMARDGVLVLAGEYWDVEYGRGDGNISLATEANSNLPSPNANISTLKASFAGKNLTSQELVLLSGAHTICNATANCTIINSNIYNGSGSPINNSIYDPIFSAHLRNECPFGVKTVRIPLTEPCGPKFNNQYYTNVEINKALFPSDHALMNSNDTKAWVDFYSKNNSQFQTDFGPAMIKMGRTQVKPYGYVRKNCSIAFS